MESTHCSARRGNQNIKIQSSSVSQKPLVLGVFLLLLLKKTCLCFLSKDQSALERNKVSPWLLSASLAELDLSVLGLLGASQDAAGAGGRLIISYPLFAASSILFVFTKGFRICRGGDTAVMGLIGEAHPSTRTGWGASRTRQSWFNSSYLEQFMWVRNFSPVRFSSFLIIFSLQASINCQAELVLKQARSGREGTNLSVSWIIHSYTFV